MQIADSLEDLTENFPLKFIVLFQWILAHEVFQGLTVAILHLNVEDFDALSSVIFSFHYASSVGQIVF